MIRRSFIRKLERKVNRKMRKHYRDSSYFYVSKATMYFQDLKDITNLECVAGYIDTPATETTPAKYKQISFNFCADKHIVRTIKEFVAVFFVHLMGALDEIPYFEEK